LVKSSSFPAVVDSRSLVAPLPTDTEEFAPVLAEVKVRNPLVGSKPADTNPFKSDRPIFVLISAARLLASVPV